MADREIIVLNEGNSQLEALQSGDRGIIADVIKSKHYQVGSLDAPPSNPMTPDVIGIFSVLRADDTTEESMHVSVHVPTDWKSGTDLDIHLHYINISAQTGVKTVRSGIEYKAVADGESATGGETSIEVDHSLPDGVAAEVFHESPALVISEADIVVGDIIGIRVYRAAAHANDDAVDDMGYDGLHLEYISNIVG